MGYSPWGRKELDTTEGLSLTRSVIAFLLKSPERKAKSSAEREEPLNLTISNPTPHQDRLVL